MQLTNKNKDNVLALMNEFFCELTEFLDEVSGIAKENENNEYHWRHYILADAYCRNKKCLAIRIPGGTVGGIWIDDNSFITKIVIDINYVVKTYPSDINDQVQKFIGKKITFKEEEHENDN